MAVLSKETDIDIAKLVLDQKTLIEYLFGTINYEEDENIQTCAAVTIKKGLYTILINPNLINNYDLKEILYHEFSHILLNHFLLVTDINKPPLSLEEKKKWLSKLNIATDFEINVRFPKRFQYGININSIRKFLDKKYKRLNNKSLSKKTAEQIFFHLDDNLIEENENNIECDFLPFNYSLDENGETEEKAEATIPFFSENFSMISKEDLELAETFLKEEITTLPEEIKNSWSGFGSFETRFSVPEATHKLSFHKLLSIKFNGYGSLGICSGRSKPMKRKSKYISRVRVLKKTKRPLLVVDTSSSIDEKLFTFFLSEINGFLKKFNETIDLCFIDTQMRILENINHLEEEEIPRYGGTEFYPIYDHISKNQDTYSQVIFFTDGGVCPPEKYLHEEMYAIIPAEYIKAEAQWTSAMPVLKIHKEDYKRR